MLITTAAPLKRSPILIHSNLNNPDTSDVRSCGRSSAIALVNHDGEAFQLGLTLIPLVTVVIWGTATVLCALALTPSRLWMLGRRLLPTRRSGIWDDWLDSPEPHHS